MSVTEWWWVLVSVFAHCTAESVVVGAHGWNLNEFLVRIVWSVFEYASCLRVWCWKGQREGGVGQLACYWVLRQQSVVSVFLPVAGSGRAALWGGWLVMAWSGLLFENCIVDASINIVIDRVFS